MSQIMERFNALEKEWIRMLDSGEDSTILTTLHQIRNSGSVRMLPHVIQLLDKSLKDALVDHILQFLGEVKAQEAVPIMVESLDKMEKTPLYAQFLSACWQTGLDFSPHIPRFVEIFIRSDYQASLEAFTIIEESLHNAGEDIIESCLQQLRTGRNRIGKEKYPLYLELIRTVGDS